MGLTKGGVMRCCAWQRGPGGNGRLDRWSSRAIPAAMTVLFTMTMSVFAVASAHADRWHGGRHYWRGGDWGGAGWYNTTLHYDDLLDTPDETHQKFGAHLGGGVQVPLSRSAGLDLGGRYVWISREHSDIYPAGFSQESWTTTVGLAFKF